MCDPDFSSVKMRFLRETYPVLWHSGYTVSLTYGIVTLFVGLQCGHAVLWRMGYSRFPLMYSIVTLSVGLWDFACGIVTRFVGLRYSRACR